MDTNTVDNLIRLKTTCANINKTPMESITALKDLQEILKVIPDYLLQNVEPIILSCLFPLISPQSFSRISESHKKVLIDALTILFSKTKITKADLFFNLYVFLLFSIYDPKANNLLNTIQEETKLSIILCIKNLFQALSWDILTLVYKKENSPKLCQVIFVCLELAEKEKLRSLRIAAMECIMIIAKVDIKDLEYDLEMRKLIADVFMFVFPGLTCKLKNIAGSDFKAGHKVIAAALKTWGKLTCLLMEDYLPIDQHLESAKILQKQLEENYIDVVNRKATSVDSKNKFKNAKEVKDYVEKTERTEKWYEETDEKLVIVFEYISKLSTHENELVRQELNDVSKDIFRKCYRNMPKSSVVIIEIILTNKSSSNLLFLESFKEMFLEYEFCIMLEKLKKRFLNSILGLPRAFNSLDEIEQLKNLKLITGYLYLFKLYRFEYLDSDLLDYLFPALLEICPFEKPEFSILEEINYKEFEESDDQQTPWISLNFLNNSIENTYYELLNELSNDKLFNSTTAFMTKIIGEDEENSITAMFILNKTFDFITNEQYQNLEKKLRDILKIYLAPEFTNLPVSVAEDKYGYNYLPLEIRNNIVKICLQMDGIGKIALIMKTNFSDRFLLLSIFDVLQRAGSPNYLIHLAGLQATKNIANACGYSNISKLIQNYPDFFSYHVTRRIDRLECNESVLNVVAAVLKLSNAEILPSISEIVESIITQSCDKFNEYLATAYLNVFKVFLKYIQQWFCSKENPRVYKTKKEKDNEFENYKLSGVQPEYTDYSDETVMGNKTPEEMYKEILEKYKDQPLNEDFQEDDDIEEYKKPDPPLFIKIVATIVKRSLHFLPSKIKERKILVLEILKEGTIILRDYEDELLPIVHLIWSPLAKRFDETDSVIVNLSFQLLATLGRLSKDFIRHRTSKEVLPNIIKIISKSAKDSYLKDKGSHFRQTQTFKMQQCILTELPNIIMDLDLNQEDVRKFKDAILPYLSNKQPMPLQSLCIEFFKKLLFYDPTAYEATVHDLETKYSDDSEYVANVNKIRT